MSISKILIPNFVCALTNKRKHNELNFHSVARVMPRVGTLGAGGGGGKKLKRGDL